MVNSDEKYTKKVMQTFNESGSGVPAFLAKLWRLVEDPETNDLICWSKDGGSFIIQNQARFARDLLPLNYKHNNMASFIRQLNMYGFHKITSIENGGLKFDRDEMEFSHPCFKRNCPYLLEHIKRKIASNKIVDEKAALKPETVSKVLQDVKTMRGRQDSLDTRFSVMKQENEALWREIASLRQKHAKQQQIVNKLIQFLITIVQPQRNMTSVQRHIQLMIDNAPDNTDKMRKANKSEKNCGPIIHELSEELLDEVADTENELPNNPDYPIIQESKDSLPNIDAGKLNSEIERPQSSNSTSSRKYEFSNQNIEETLTYGNANTSNNAVAIDGNKEALIQAVDADGSQFFYHVTEVNDAQPNEMSPSRQSYNDDNVLTTPMVREEMARRHMLKEKNKQRRMKDTEDSQTPNKYKLARLNDNKAEVNQPETNTTSTVLSAVPLCIKTEQDLNPMMFLNIYGDEQDGVNLTSDPNLASPNLSEGSHQSTNLSTDNFLMNTGFSDTSNTTTAQKGDSNAITSDLYNSNTFLNNDMPTDIFEDTTLMSSGDNSNISCENFTLGQQQERQQKQDILESFRSAKKEKLSMYLSDNEKVNTKHEYIEKNDVPSTSAAATANITNNIIAKKTTITPTSTITTNNNCNTQMQMGITPTTSKIADVNPTNGNMALTKYQQNDDIMQLSTADEFHYHLDSIQDELDSLKDILRSDSYSLDHNTLSGLFNESEILSPYGLTYYTDDNIDKKDSELLACQSIYDLTDIINDQNYLDDEANNESVTETKLNSETSCSELNTPRHE